MRTSPTGSSKPDEPAPTSERREPRFVYLSDETPESSQRGRPPVVASPRARFGWRLDAANHRPLGRAGFVALSLDACVALAQSLRDDLPAAHLTISAAGDRAQWTWRLSVRGVTAAVSPHGFARRVECQRAYEHFADAVQVADPARGVVRNFGPRALRGFELDPARDRSVFR